MSPLLGIVAILLCVAVATLGRRVAHAVRRAAARHIRAEEKRDVEDSGGAGGAASYAKPTDATASASLEKRRDASSRRS